MSSLLCVCMFSVPSFPTSSNCSLQLWARKVRGGTLRQFRGMVSIRGSCSGSITSSGYRPMGHASPARYSRLDGLHTCLIDDVHCYSILKSRVTVQGVTKPFWHFWFYTGIKLALRPEERLQEMLQYNEMFMFL